MLSVKNVSKIYKTKGGVVTKALDDVSIDFPAKGMIFLLGRSGSGKSTLLNIIGGLDKPDKGEVIIKGKSSKSFTGNDFDSYRNTFIGFIFQEYNILNEFNVEQNIGLALQLQGKKADKEKINQLLEQVDLKGVAKRKPNTLSGGQKQRIAIARALIKEPQIIMADEPTGALDSKTGKQVFDTLKKLSQEKLVIVVSHDREFAKQYGDRIVELKDGKILTDETKEFVEPENKNDNYCINGNGVIQIKDASKLTPIDAKNIIAAIKKNKGEVIISNPNTNDDVKKALKLRDDGSSEVFNTTKEVSIDKYDGNKTEFIKSKMPISRAFKMGASGLKTKPIRLIFTILLSSISFAMFGIVSTFMMYNPNHTIKTALAKSDYVTESVVKTYSTKSSYVEYNYKTGKKTERSQRDESRNTYFGKEEFKEFNSKNNNRFAGAFKLSSYGNENKINMTGFNPSSYPYYKYNYFYNVSDCGKDYADSNFEMVSTNGHYPTNSNEIAISSYVADTILSDTSLNLQTYNNIVTSLPNIEILGNTSVGNFKKEVKITAVYKIAEIPEKYKALQKEKESSVSDIERNELVTEFNGFISNGFFLTAFVNDTFYDENVAAFQPYLENRSSQPQVGISGVKYDRNKISSIEKIDQTTYFSVIDKDLMDETKYPMTYYNLNREKVSNINLKDDETIVSILNYYIQIKDKEGELGRLENLFKNIGFNGYRTPQSGSTSIVTVSNPLIYKLNDNMRNTLNDDTNLGNFEQAITRLNTYNNNYSITTYTGGEAQYNKDITLLKSLLNDNDYKDLFNKFYIYKVYESYRSNFSLEEGYNDSENAYFRINNYLCPNDIVGRKSEYESPYSLNDDLATIKNFIEPKINANPKYIYHYLGETLINNCSNSRQSTLYTLDFQKLLDDLLILDDVEETMSKVKTILDENFKDCLGVDPIYKFDINQFGDKPYYGTSELNLYYKDYKKNEGKLKVVGFYESSYEGNPILTRNAFKDYVTDSSNIYYSVYKSDYTAPDDMKYSTIITKTNYSDQDINLMMQTFPTFKYEMSNKVYSNVKTIIDLVSQFKSIFFYVGLATGGLAALLMVNFISASISAKKKDIGILRAVGAKGGDVFKIFYSESSIISICCFLISAIGSGVACYFLNKFIGTSLASLLPASANISIISFGIVNILVVLGVSIVITFLATLVPVLLASKKPPVESIRAL